MIKVLENLQTVNELSEINNNPIIKIMEMMPKNESFDEWSNDVSKYNLKIELIPNSSDEFFNYIEIIGRRNDIIDFYVNEVHEDRNDITQWVDNEGEIINENKQLKKIKKSIKLKENQELYKLPYETQIAILSDFDYDKPIYSADGTDSIKWAIESAIWQAIDHIDTTNEEIVVNISKRKKTNIDDEGNIV